MNRGLPRVGSSPSDALARLADLLCDCRLIEIPSDLLPEAIGQVAGLQAALHSRLLGPIAPPADDRLLGVEEAASMLSIAPQTLYRKARELPFTVRLGTAVRFSEAGIQEFIRSRQGF